MIDIRNVSSQEEGAYHINVSSQGGIGAGQAVEEERVTVDKNFYCSLHGRTR